MTRTTSIILAALLSIPLLITSCRKSEPLPVFYPVPSVVLTADNGRPLGLDELHGRAAIYSFIFTRCAGTCPVMARSMQTIASRTPATAPVRFVMISVDPDYDTPAVMKKYRDSLGADDRWVFLTGDVKTITSLSVEGFKLASVQPSSGAEPLLHSTKFVLVDSKGQIRGYYDALTEEGLDKLVADLENVQGEAH